jgi:uncharacterized radical SAM superfamily protein
VSRKIHVFKPDGSFPTVSVSGKMCGLFCDHCRGKYLSSMTDVSKPGTLYGFAIDLWNKGGEGLLISGGCDRSGTLLLEDHHMEEIRRIKEETGLVINMHTGLIGKEKADELGKSGIDVVSLDVIGRRDIIKKVLHLDAGPDDYRRTYGMLRDAGIRVVPHILAGLDYGGESGEIEAVDLIGEFDPPTAVLIILIPTSGTPMENMPVPSYSGIFEIARHMRSKLASKLVLGCMRPRSYEGLETDLLDMGFTGIVSPSRNTVKAIKRKGWVMEEHRVCCSTVPI